MKLFEKEQLGDSVQVDVKVVKLAKEKVFQYTALDDCTRMRVLRLYPRLNHHASLDFLREMTEAFPFTIRKIQCDNGLPQKSRDTRRRRASLRRLQVGKRIPTRIAKRFPPSRNHTLTIVT